MLRLRAPSFDLVPGPEGPNRREDQQQDENPLRGECLHARIDAHRINVRRAGDNGDPHDVSFLELPNSLTHENERQVIEKQTRHGEEGPHWNLDAVTVEESEDHSECSEADDDSECERKSDVWSFTEQRLIKERGLGAFAIDCQERDDRECFATTVLECRSHFLANELLPLRGFHFGDEPVAD